MTFASDSYYFQATFEFLKRRLICRRRHLSIYCFCILFSCYPSWHHYYRPTRGFWAHSPLICVCHPSVDVKAFSAVQPLFTAVSVCFRRLPESAEKNNVVVGFTVGRQIPVKDRPSRSRRKRKLHPFKSKWDTVVREKERRGRRKRN